jgi:hypothetical protein
MQQGTSTEGESFLQNLLLLLIYYPDFVFETVESLGLDIEEFMDKIFG